MPKAPPKVSVIVPCFNQAEGLEKTVESVLQQTSQDLEIVIVNDGSTDADTKRLLLSYDRPGARIVQSDTRGLAAARNLAIEHSLGRYLCVLQPMDTLRPTFLANASAVLDGDDEVGFVLCSIRWTGDEGRSRPQGSDLAALLAECTVPAPALVRASSVREAGGYDGNIAAEGYQDCDLLISLLERGLRGSVLPDVLADGPRRSGVEGEAHLRLTKEIVSKHDASARRCLLDALIRKEAVSSDILKETYALDREIDGRLVPRIQRRRDELDRLRTKLEAAEAQQQARDRLATLEREAGEDRRRLEELSAELARKEAELAILLESRSWRITAPLRSVYEPLWRWRHARGAASRPSGGGDEGK